MPPAPHSADELLVNLAWMRALAARLTPCLAEAEDLTQEAALRALASPSASRLRGPRLRAWLARAVRGLALDQRRAAERRRRREERSAKPEGYLDLPADPGSERLQALASALLALEEPYRTALFLRYGEGLDCAALARRTGVSGATARQRLSRGRARLRLLLQPGDEPGSPLAGMSVALPLLDLLQPRTWIVMHTWKLGAAAALALAIPATLVSLPGTKSSVRLASVEPAALDAAPAAPSEPSPLAPGTRGPAAGRLGPALQGPGPEPSAASPSAQVVPAALAGLAAGDQAGEEAAAALDFSETHAPNADPASCAACHSNPGDLAQLAGGPDGWTQERDGQGRLLAEGLLKLGRRSGKWREYGEGERLVRELEYRAGREHGALTEYGEEGQVMARGRYVQGQKEATWSRWSPEGQLVEQVHFEAGRKDGVETQWWPSSSLAAETRWVLGLRHGTFRRWHANGQLAQRGRFERGARAGAWEAWNEAGEAE